MLVSLVLRAIAPLRMASSLPLAGCAGVIASRGALGHRTGAGVRVPMDDGAARSFDTSRLQGRAGFRDEPRFD